MGRARGLAPNSHLAALGTLPECVVGRSGPGRFEVRYDDGADLMWQLAEFIAAVGTNREEYIRGTEPAGE